MSCSNGKQFRQPNLIYIFPFLDLVFFHQLEKGCLMSAFGVDDIAERANIRAELFKRGGIDRFGVIFVIQRCQDHGLNRRCQCNWICEYLASFIFNSCEQQLLAQVVAKPCGICLYKPPIASFQ